jgi:transposase
MALDYESTIITAVELSASSWLVGAQVPSVLRQCRQKLAPSAEALLEHLGRLRQRAERAGKRVSRMVVAYEAGRDGFWLARWLIAHGIEVDVIQPASVPVDRRAKTDALDVEMLLRTTLAWLRGEPRVCSMVPIPSEAEEDGRRPLRERQELIKERLAITNKIDGLMATLGIGGYRPLRRDRREQVETLRQPSGDPLPVHAKARLTRLLDRLELVLEQIKGLEKARDAVVAHDDVGSGGEADRMIRKLAG